MRTKDNEERYNEIIIKVIDSMLDYPALALRFL
jgi:hypothetical protein